MSKDYPIIDGFRRRPNKKFDGSKNYGKPCVFCGVGTIGERWVQMSCMRGEDETVRVCAEHCKEDDQLTIQKMYEQEKSKEEALSHE